MFLSAISENISLFSNYVVRKFDNTSGIKVANNLLTYDKIQQLSMFFSNYF